MFDDLTDESIKRFAKEANEISNNITTPQKHKKKPPSFLTIYIAMTNTLIIATLLFILI